MAEREESPEVQEITDKLKGFGMTEAVDEQDPTIQALRRLQNTHKELEAAFDKERRLLKQKYMKQYDPLYQERYKLITAPKEGAQDEGTPPVKGFWYTAMSNCNECHHLIQPQDKPVLKYLKDIRYAWLDDVEQSSFTLTFEFAPNPYFEQTTLSKTFILKDDETGEKILDKTEGTEIQWKKGQNITEKVVERKQKNKKTKQVRVVVETIPRDSFFTFFESREIPSEEEFDKMDPEELEEFENTVKDDFDAGVAIRDKIIPRALGWFLNEEINDVGSDDEYDESDDSDSDDEDDDDDIEP